MRYSTAISTAMAVVLCSTLAQAAEPVPGYAPAPSWVEPVKVPTPNPQLKDLPAQILILSVQEMLAEQSSTTYLEYTAVPQTVAGLQSAGTMAMPWNVERTDLTIHKLEINRGGKVIDAFDPKQLMVLRQEANLDKAMLDGGRTVVLPIRGIQLGDRVTVAASYKTKPAAVPLQTEELVLASVNDTINRIERRMLVPDDVSMRWYRSPEVAAPATTKRDGLTEYRFSMNNTKTREWPDGTPQRFKLPVIQASAWSTWNDVAASMLPLYARTSIINDNSPLAQEADKIAAATKDPEQRTLAALRLAQEQVRYVALLLGEGAYTPVAADQTWEQRFGDCKGKTVLLIGLLKRLGIEAHPMLVSSNMDGLVGQLLPSLGIFDHVIVRAMVNGKTLYLDPTDYGQRTLAELGRSAFTRGLPLTNGSNLLTIERSIPALPLQQADLVWDGRQGFERKVPFTATLILRDEVATIMRAAKASSGDKDKHTAKLKNFIPGVGNDDMQLQSEEPEHGDGTYRATFTGTAEMDWSPIKGMKGHRYELSHATVNWEFDGGRTEAQDKDIPLSFNWPYSARSSETILLPNGGKGFKVEGAAIDRRFGGVHVTRTVALQGDKAVTVSSFVHEEPEVDAEAVRSIKLITTDLNKKFAYVLAPGKIRPVSQEVTGK